jgi:serine/tyrosine/threonine adenylyltransferase
MSETRALDNVDGPELGIAFDNTYARELEGTYVPWAPRAFPQAELLLFNETLAGELNFPASNWSREQRTAVFAGNLVPRGAAPLAQAYAGHQFGGFSPRLGDGRALLLGEVIDRAGGRRDVAFKGSGRTPFSRGGDGLAAVGPMLREYVVSEAMHALGVPSTRSLAVVATGEMVRRENALPGAVLTRVAASHLRVGTFQFFAARQEHDVLKRVLDYAIARHDSDLQHATNPALAFLERVSQRQAKLIAHWMSLGFIHGVMNTDNMTISGETIDYGPCAFMETFDPAAVFSSIDHHGRYAYANQPNIAQWNLARLAEALLPLMGDDSDEAVRQVMPILEAFPVDYETHWLSRMSAKLGLSPEVSASAALVKEHLTLLHDHDVDFTLGFRRLSDVLRNHAAPVRELHTANPAAFDDWCARWRAALGAHANERSADQMDAVNPIAIARNHHVEAALTDACERNELTKVSRLLSACATPFVEHDTYTELYAPAAAEFTRGYQTFCGT